MILQDILEIIDNAKPVDDDLDKLATYVAVEKERRANLKAIPAQIARLASIYTNGGGDPMVLTTVVEAATAQPAVETSKPWSEVLPGDPV